MKADVVIIDAFADHEFTEAGTLIASLPARKKNFAAEADEFLRCWVF